MVTYDLRGDEDELWWIGNGHDGMLSRLLQLLDNDNQYKPMRLIANGRLTVAAVRAAGNWNDEVALAVFVRITRLSGLIGAFRPLLDTGEILTCDCCA
jgi:hypothetical protein